MDITVTDRDDKGTADDSTGGGITSASPQRLTIRLTTMLGPTPQARPAPASALRVPAGPGHRPRPLLDRRRRPAERLWERP